MSSIIQLTIVISNLTCLQIKTDTVGFHEAVRHAQILHFDVYDVDQVIFQTFVFVCSICFEHQIATLV